MAVGVGYGSRNIHRIDWTLVAIEVAGAIVGGIIGYMLSVIGLLGGIVLLIAVPFLNLQGNMRAFVVALSISMIAGGLASIIAGGSQALSSEALAQSDNIFAQMTAIPMSINEKFFDLLKIQKLQLSPEMIPPETAQAIVSQYAITGQGTESGATWGY